MNRGMIWKGWTVGELIGEGSFGKVYRIYREDYGRVYESALKVIRIPQSKAEENAVRSEVMTDDRVWAYFRSSVESIIDEISFMSRLRGNSNIVSYEDHSVDELTGEFGWQICIRMELLTPFLRHIQTRPVTAGDVIRMGIDICKALETCEKEQIIHRDIKPENIFRSAQGFYKLGDFGIARQMEKSTAGMSKKGTFSYMAPEVVKGLPYDHTVDIYSLGVVLYRFLNNNRGPFLPPYPEVIYHNNKEEANEKRLNGAAMAPPCNGAGKAGEVILKACSFRPEDRYQTAEEFRLALESALTEEMDRQPAIPDQPSVRTDGSSAAGAQPLQGGDEGSTRMTRSPMDPPQPVKKRPARKKGWIIAGAAAAVVVAGLLVGMALFVGPGKGIFADEGWKEAYADILKDNEDSIRTYESVYYASVKKPASLCDINGDGTPELLFFSHADENMLRIFTYRDGKAQEVEYSFRGPFPEDDGNDLWAEGFYDPQAGGGMRSVIYQEGGEGLIICSKMYGEENSLRYASYSMDEKGVLTQDEAIGETFIADPQAEQPRSFYQDQEEIDRSGFDQLAAEMSDEITTVLMEPGDWDEAEDIDGLVLPDTGDAANANYSYDEVLARLGNEASETMVNYQEVISEYYQFIENEESDDVDEMMTAAGSEEYPHISPHFAGELREINESDYGDIEISYALHDIDGNGTDEMILRWNEDGGMAVYGLDGSGSPHLIADSDDLTICGDGRIIDHYEEYSNSNYDSYYGGPYESFTVWRIGSDGYEADVEEYYSMEWVDSGDGYYEFYKDSDQITEKEYRKIENKLSNASGVELEWTKLKEKSVEWQ